jgi:hypothetical protein
MSYGKARLRKQPGFFAEIWVGLAHFLKAPPLEVQTRQVTRLKGWGGGHPQTPRPRMHEAPVIPAKAGTHLPPHPQSKGPEMDSRLRGNDGENAKQSSETQPPPPTHVIPDLIRDPASSRRRQDRDTSEQGSPDPVEGSRETNLGSQCSTICERPTTMASCLYGAKYLRLGASHSWTLAGLSDLCPCHPTV